MGTRMTRDDSIYGPNGSLYNELKSALESNYAEDMKSKYKDMETALTRKPYFAPWNSKVMGNVAVGINKTVGNKATHTYGQVIDENETNVPGLNSAVSGYLVDELKAYGPQDIKDKNGEAAGNPAYEYSVNYFVNAQNQDYTPSTTLKNAVGTGSGISNIDMSKVGITDKTVNANFTAEAEIVNTYTPVYNDNNEVVITWDRVANATKYIITVSENEDLSSPISVKTVYEYYIQ